MQDSEPRKSFHLLVTGAGSGIGREIALEFAKGIGTNFVLVGRTKSKLEQTALELKKNNPDTVVHIIDSDLSDRSARVQLLEKIKKCSTQIDCLVNNAGMFFEAPILETPDEVIEKIFSTNVIAPMALCRDLLPLVENAQGSIVNISSTLAHKAIANTVAYNSSKAAILQMTKSLALELGPRGIRVNAILPAIVDTPMYRNRLALAKLDQSERELMQKASELHPLGRTGTAGDIAKACYFLASQNASWITGACLPVDGGMLSY